MDFWSLLCIASKIASRAENRKNQEIFGEKLTPNEKAEACGGSDTISMELVVKDIKCQEYVEPLCFLATGLLA